MKSGREELRRGVREILEGASQDLESLMSTPVPPPEERRPHTAATEARPVLRLVRDPAPHVPAAAVPPPIPEAVLPEMPAVLPKNGGCQAFFNTALQVCMTRECPIYHLYKGEMERRFAAKFAHFW